MNPIAKPLASERKLRKHASRVKLQHDEDEAKKEVRRRDGFKCRFPLCGCRRLGWRLEVSHARHKGAGGNPAGDRSTPAGLILLCAHRHQEGVISRHKGTLRIRALTRKGMNGPVAFDVNSDDLPEVTVLCAVALGASQREWLEVARESAVGVHEPLLPWQMRIIDSLSEMEL